MNEEQYQITDKGRVVLAASEVLTGSGMESDEAWPLAVEIADEAEKNGISTGKSVEDLISAMANTVIDLELVLPTLDPEEEDYHRAHAVSEELTALIEWADE